MRLKRFLVPAYVVLGSTLAACAGTDAGTHLSTMTPTLASPATIETSASTNTPVSSIVVRPDGTATITQTSTARNGSISTTLANTFFADLNANVPVSSYPIATSCAKSASFGTTTTIAYRGATSGDVSCAPNGSTTSQIYADVQQIRSALGTT